MVYSVADRASFDTLHQYWKDIETFANSLAGKILVSTQNDLPAQLHAVSSSEGQTWAQNHKIPFVEVSAKTSQGLEHLKHLIMQQRSIQEYYY